MIKWSKLVFFLSVGLGLANPVAAQQAPTREQGTPPLGFEAGVIMGIIAQPYASATVVVAPWSFRVSGASWPQGSGLQLNAGRVVRDDGSATHTLGIMWARFENEFSRDRRRNGQYAGVFYDFQVKGFFIEVGPAFGAPNPVLTLGPLRHIYGQIGYVYRIGRYKSGDRRQETVDRRQKTGDRRSPTEPTRPGRSAPGTQTRLKKIQQEQARKGGTKRQFSYAGVIATAC